MAHESDPNRLSGVDFLRAIAPLFYTIVMIFLVIKYIDDFDSLALIAVIAVVFYVLSRLPKKDKAAADNAERELEGKIESIPVVGPVAGLSWRLTNWVSSMFPLVSIAFLIFLAVNKLL